MAGSLNRVVLLGRLVRNVRLRTFYDPDKAVAHFTLAMNRTIKSKDGTTRNEATFVPCTAWGKTATLIEKTHRKGDPILVVGRLTLDRWQDELTGENRQRLRVTVDRFQFAKDRTPAASGA